ncbi:PadR family transcriptional regulator [Streptomyces sp. NPDC002205]|uniref:PadR family transcriptional regulator n=1 Tax=Streptomyces sp. NPDC002205 TaxID=3154411 RepID=UPI00331EF684
MSIGHTLLGLLESGLRHGCDLKRAVDEKFGHGRPLRCGQVYSTMSRVLKNGLGVVDDAEAGGGPERKRYAITDASITDVQKWFATREKPEPYFRSTTHRGAAGVLLVHQSIGIPLAKGLIKAVPGLGLLPSMVVSVICMLGLAALVYKRVEHRLGRLLRHRLKLDVHLQDLAAKPAFTARGSAR